MIRAFPEKTRQQLDTVAYKWLRIEILRRDAWRCQYCGCMQNLDVHHIQPRARAGEDSGENLIVLCRGCHNAVHNVL